MSTIRLPPALRETVGSREVESEGSTVIEVLSNFAQAFPAVHDQIFDQDGRLRPYINVYLNKQDIQYLEALNTPSGPTDTIILLPAMAGGRGGSRS